MFNNLNDAIIHFLSYLVNAFSGLFQVGIYLTIGLFFIYGMARCWQALRSLAHFDFSQLDENSRGLEQPGDDAPLAVVAASFFCKTKRHYLLEKRNDHPSQKAVPPDGFIRDAAFQYSERYFEERFLQPITLTANLMPALGFIGTVLGISVHFLSNTGSLNSNLTVTGIATALYTTFIGLVCFTVLEFLIKVFYGLGRKRIDEGLAAVADRVVLAQEKRGS
jgi:biopolymer transport protein ExbB/TolQ